jgi:hypothetical protein
MKSALIDLFTSKKFLAAIAAIVIYVSGRFGFDVDPAALDRIFAALLVYIGAQGVADHGKSAALVVAAADDARAARWTPSANVPAGLALEQGNSLALLALVVLGLAAAASSSACTPAQRTTVGHAVVDCTAGNAVAIGALVASMRGDCAAGAGTDWGCVRSHAITDGILIGGCAFLQLVSAEPAPARVASATGEPPPERPGRAAFESYRASVAGGAAFRTRDGDR